MLQFIRSKAGSFLVKILFVLLIASFGVWGIGDFLRQTSADATVIQVGSRKIRGEEVQREVQNQIDRQRQSGMASFDLAQAKALGMVDQVVDGIINRNLLDLEVQRQGFLTGPKQIAQIVEGEAAFKGPNGQFDKNTFRAALAEHGMTEASYGAQLTEELPRSMAVTAAGAFDQPPKTLIDLLYKGRGEQRIADWVYLPAGAAKDIPAPDDGALQAYYNQHHDAFTAPEYRGYTVLLMVPANVADQVKITDDQIKESYQQRQDDFTVAEKRHVLQMLLPDEKTATDAAAQLAAGKDFLQVAKDVAKQDPATVDLGFQAKKDLPNENADIVFGAADGTVTKPTKGAFGWTLIKVAGIQTGSVKMLDAVKPEIEADLRKAAESDELYKLSNKVQDALAAGAELGQIAEQFALKPVTVAAADETGKTPDGKPVEGKPPVVGSVIATVFKTPQGQVSSVEEVKDNDTFYVIKVDHITPPALKPFNQVKTEVQAAWTTDQRATKVAAQAKALVDAITQTNSLAKAAGAQKLQVATTKPFDRTNKGNVAPLPGPLVGRLFQLKPGEAANVATAQGQFVAQLEEIKQADPTADKAGSAQITASLQQDLGRELVTQFQNTLRQRYKVEIHQAALDNLFATSDQP